MFNQRSELKNYLTLSLATAQAVLGSRVLWRLLGTGLHTTTVPMSSTGSSGESIAIIVPVLNELLRLEPCLEGLLAQGPDVTQILVVDGGSEDGTQDLVRSFATRDPRIQLVDASPVPGDWNGKSWGLQRGLDQVDESTDWILTIDADVRPRARLVESLIDFANVRELRVLSVATRQQIETLSEGLVHPALLTTLVYRFGIPGGVFRRPADVQANGQCFLIHRDLLSEVGEFRSVKSSVCEDVTLAREIAAAGHPIGFFETDDLVSVRMYPDGWTTLREWPRSLPMRDRFFGWAGLLGLVEVVLIQSAPIPLLAISRLSRVPRWFTMLETVFVVTRLGVLFGTSRAYQRVPWTYWISPLFDLPASILLVANTFRRRYVWRGRALSRGGTP